MSGFIKGENRQQATSLPERVDDYVTEENSASVIEVFIDSLQVSFTSLLAIYLISIFLLMQAGLRCLQSPCILSGTKLSVCYLISTTYPIYNNWLDTIESITNRN